MKNRKYWIAGLIGCICFGIGDWLLGYVDPGPVTEQFAVLKAGHGAEYDLTKLTVTLFLGMVGVPFMMPGCMRMAELATDEKRKRIMGFSMMLLPVGWLMIHFTVSCGIFAYAWSMQHGAQAQAQELALSVMRMFRSTQLAADLLAGIPLVLLPVYVLRGGTVLRKTSQLFTPLLWMALLSALKFIVPATPLSNGIDTFCMNAGMIIWFVYLTVTQA